MNSSDPTGNGETRGPESAGQQGTPLPGTRPSRASANNARYSRLDMPADPKEQGGFGKEDMQGDCSYMSGEAMHLADELAPPPNLAAMGNGGESFGGS